MIVPLIMAVWFAIVAKNHGRNWFGWAVMGAAIALVVGNIVVFLGGHLFGPFSLDAAIPFLIISMIASIAITGSIGAAITATLKKPENPR